MSNRIDFFQSEETRLALPAATVSVLVDGRLCPELEVMEIVRGGWPEFSWARLAYNPAAYAEAELKSTEEMEVEFAMGKPVCIRRNFNGILPGSAAFSVPVFEGQIEALQTKLGPADEKVEIIAKDFSASVKRVTVYGRRVATDDGSTLFLPGLGTAFNLDGQANADPTPAEVNGKSYIVFCARSSQAKLWSYAEIIEYLLNEYLPTGHLQLPGVKLLRGLTEDRYVRGLEVTGLNLLEALQRCCEAAGLRFKFAPRLAETGPRQAIVFYKNGTGRVVELNCQPKGQQLSISRTDIANFSSRKNFWPVTHEYIGLGDFKVYEATFELVKAWSWSLEDTDYDKFSPSTNPEFYKVKDVFRKWCLNEAGDYTGEPYSQGQAFDFSKIFDSSNYIRRRRRFWPALTTDQQGKSLGYFLEVSFDGGVHWWQYLYAFNNLLDECGIWLSSDRLDIDTWIAAVKGVLKFRITASVVSDERLTAVLADGPVGSVASVVKRVIFVPRQFKFRQVSGKSIFAHASGKRLGVPDQVDDTDALYEFVRHKAAVSSHTIETVDVQTPMLAFDYEVGDRVTSGPESRDLLSCRSDNRSERRIERVQMDFVRQCTNLKIARKRRV